MTTMQRDGRWRQLALPLAILAVPMVLSVVSYGEWLLVAVPIMLAVGVAFNPRPLWGLWLGAVLLMWVVYGTATLVGALPEPGAEGDGETIWSFAIESFFYMAALALLPAWIGRMIGGHDGGPWRRLHHGGRGGTHAPPAA
jgi:hypothetical protein